jgi:hypothetical protein
MRKHFPVVYHTYTAFESHPSSCSVGTGVLLFAGKVTETRNWPLSCVYCRDWLAAELCFYFHSSSNFGPSLPTGKSYFITLLRCYILFSSKWQLFKRFFDPIDLLPHVRYTAQGSTHPGCQVALVTKLCMVAPTIVGFSVWNLFHVPLLEPWILRSLLNFWKHMRPWHNHL